MSNRTIAILSPGDMGHRIGRALGEHGHDLITCLAGRSERTRGLAEKGGFDDAEDLETVTRRADLILSIIPPSDGPAMAETVAAAMERSGHRPPYADCNALAPATARRIASIIEAAGAPFIDASICSLAPSPGDLPRIYASGTDTSPLEALDGHGIAVKPLGSEVGRASGIKMCYGGLTKGIATLHTAVLLAAEAMGLSDELRDELMYSQKDTYAAMQYKIPRFPADSARWIGEMEEGAASFTAVGVTPNFHRGAVDIYALLSQTPLALETRETIDSNRTLEESVRVFASHRPRPGS
ncbi:MAG: DUF1932 domain-containing protein [Rhodospirillales bacterium]|nr:DUF1932 domain-containing protein [Rhodospirillales bacterium]